MTGRHHPRGRRRDRRDDDHLDAAPAAPDQHRRAPAGASRPRRVTLPVSASSTTLPGHVPVRSGTCAGCRPYRRLPCPITGGRNRRCTSRSGSRPCPRSASISLVGLVIGLESLGIPLPGEIVLVSSALLASQHGDIDPFILGACAIAARSSATPSATPSAARAAGHCWPGSARKFPKHFGAGHIATAERSFEKWGMWAVFFGRFVALLRIFAGPLAGVLQMPYWKFLIANVLGGILWAGGTTAVIYYVGVVAEAWLKRFSWLGLVLAVLFGLTLDAGPRSAGEEGGGGARRRGQTAGPAVPATEEHGRRRCGARPAGRSRARDRATSRPAAASGRSGPWVSPGAFGQIHVQRRRSALMPSRSSSRQLPLDLRGHARDQRPGGTCIPCGTSACAATSEPAPITRAVEHRRAHADQDSRPRRCSRAPPRCARRRPARRR